MCFVSSCCAAVALLWIDEVLRIAARRQELLRGGCGVLNCCAVIALLWIDEAHVVVSVV